MTNFSTLGIFLNILLVVLCYIVLHPVWNNHAVPKSKIQLCVFLCFLLFIFPYFGGDYYHYEEYFRDIIQNPNMEGSIEPIYNFIAIHSLGIYHFFRFIVWGFALSLLLRIGKGCDVSFPIYLLILTTCFITVLAYARVTLAMSLAFWGLYYIIKESQSLSKVLWGLTIMGISFFFHKSALFGIGMGLCALIFAQLGRMGLWIMIISFPMVTGILAYLVGDFLVSSGADEVINVKVAQGYLNKEAASHGIGALILNYLQRVPFYLISFIFVKMLFNRKIELPYMQKVFGSAVFLITIVSSLFLLNFGMNTSTLYYRFLNFACIPSIVFLSYLRTKKLFNYLTSLIYRILSISVAYALLYTFYLSII